ncbi:MAG TPA: glycosyltransferase family 2 protein [Roseiarcus sp.]
MKAVTATKADYAHESRPSTGQSTPRPLLVPALNGRQRSQHRLFVAAWLASLVSLWSWWLSEGHNIDTVWFIVNSIVLAWVTLMPAYLLFLVGKGMAPNPEVVFPSGGRVAMVVTKAPSEPWPMVHHTLSAMLRQSYPHDTWLADEDPSPETEAWCAVHGVRISSRRGRPDYHRTEWPRRTRCKEGNLAFFYDHFGYGSYDFVSQLDADHVPEPGYLEEMLRPFIDPSVGYVSAPSICNHNATESWAARSRLYAEGMLHGGLQMGYNNNLAPLCFGSHYAVRTAALREIGGLGPELAEDHSTTLLMNAHGWRGVHAVNALAYGDGPETFTDMATQEFQWARSLTTLLLKYTPCYIGKLPWRLRIQFVFCQTWYLLFSVMMAISFFLPLIALGRNQIMVRVTYPEFLIYYAIPNLILVAMGYWWRRNRLVRPSNVKVISWEGAIFLLARWPWSLFGVVAGIVNVSRGREVEFRITPKASKSRVSVPFRVILPYLALSGASSFVALLFDAPAASGFYVFACMNAITYAVVMVVIVLGHVMEQQGDFAAPGMRMLSMVTVVFIFFASYAAVVRVPRGVDVLVIAADQVVNTLSRVATISVPHVNPSLRQSAYR